MATTATFDLVRDDRPQTAARPHGALTLLAAAGLPVAALGIAQMAAEELAVIPFFFAPFGLPYWVGQVGHAVQLAMLGAAFWMLVQREQTTSARYWLLGLIAAYVALPFVTPMLDALQLSFICTALFLLGAATLRRVGKVSKAAGWLMAPPLAIVGLSATMGLAVAAYAPPFALMQTHQAPPSI